MNKLTFFLTTFVITCLLQVAHGRPSWISDHRQQGGGWIWHPGNSLNITEAQADADAKGMALSNLVEECGSIHKNVKFHERYVERSRDGKVRVFVRASIESRYCGVKTNTNKVLMSVYHQYKLRLAQRQVAETVCRIDSEYCLQYAVEEAELDNWYTSLAYHQIACRHGIEGGCKMARVTLKLIQKGGHL